MMSHFEFIFIREAGYIVFQRRPYSFDCKKNNDKKYKQRGSETPKRNVMLFVQYIISTEIFFRASLLLIIRNNLLYLCETKTFLFWVN